MIDVFEPDSEGGDATRRLNAPAARHLAMVAARLFASRGFDATSVREIVEAAGVAKPMLYYYFGSKEGLARAIVLEPLGELVNQIRGIVSAEEDAVRCLERVIEAHYAFFREDPDRSRFIYAQFFGPPGSRPALDMECEKHDLSGLTESACRRLVADGIVATDRLESLNAMVHGMILVPTLGFLYKNTPLGRELAGSLVRQLLAGFDQRRPSNPTG
ncbi:TetR/AcrR family transcriptional regulator [Aquisphaera insulae]|uniref:TetR/AcrR family transcriptional regulator n=1 Tax=Aquisphaera insulae TaxID=2712864 RepID=UPI002030E484|nr:TetR/AcrR family transcriptional regulator [Aquisphaera insulae]